MSWIHPNSQRGVSEKNKRNAEGFRAKRQGSYQRNRQTSCTDKISWWFLGIHFYQIIYINKNQKSLRCPYQWNVFLQHMPNEQDITPVGCWTGRCQSLPTQPSTTWLSILQPSGFPHQKCTRLTREMHGQSIHTVDGKTPGEPVEVGSYPTICKGFVLCRWLFGISSINSSMHTELLTHLFWNGSFSIPNCNSSTCPMKFVQNSSGNMSKPRRRPTMILMQRVQSACVLAGPVCWKYWKFYDNKTGAKGTKIK